MLKNLILKVHGATMKAIHNIGLSKNETVNIGGYKYPIDEFMGYSDEKITSILESAGADAEQIKQTFAWLSGMGRK
jgi:hypothetical protein